MKRKLIIFILFSFFWGGLSFQWKNIYAQTLNRDLGNMSVSFRIGPYFPLSFQSLDGRYIATRLGTPVGEGDKFKQTPIGGIIDFDYSIFLNSDFKIGVNTFFSVSLDINSIPLFMVPLSFRTTYEPRIASFGIPIIFDLGMVFTSYDNLFSYNFILRPGIGFNWYYTEEWSLGVMLSYWFIPEIYYNNIAHQSRLANMLDLLISISYYF